MDYWVNILVQMCIYGILALSLNVICGMTGLLQLGHAGFFAIGAYAAGLLSIYSTIPSLGAGNLALGCMAAVAVTIVLAMIVGLPCLRLRGDYWAIATLSFGEIVRMVLNNVELPGCKLTEGEKFGGSSGISLPSPMWQYPDPGFSAAYANVWVVAGALLLTFLLLGNIKRSSVGRAMMCIREDEIAAKAMGIHVPKYKLLAFVLSAAFAGLAGALFAHNPNSGMTLTPGEFGLLKTVEILLIVVLGGLGSLTGTILATVVLVFLPQGLSLLPNLVQYLEAHISFFPKINPAAVGEVAKHKELVYAVLLIVLIRIMPNGILGLNEMPPFLRRLFVGRKAVTK